MLVERVKAPVKTRRTTDRNPSSRWNDWRIKIRQTSKTQRRWEEQRREHWPTDAGGKKRSKRLKQEEESGQRAGTEAQCALVYRAEAPTARRPVGRGWTGAESRLERTTKRWQGGGVRAAEEPLGAPCVIWHMAKNGIDRGKRRTKNRFDKPAGVSGKVLVGGGSSF